MVRRKRNSKDWKKTCIWDVSMKYVILLICFFILFAYFAYGQDVPGVAVGAFIERRIDNKIEGDELSFIYYGSRLQARDERFIDFFVDLGIQSFDFGKLEIDEAGTFGLGGTLWLIRAEEAVVAFDLGAYASYHTADYTLVAPSGLETDAKYNKFISQVSIRADSYGLVRPFLRAGILGSTLDMDNNEIIDSKSDEHDKKMIAVNVGFEISFGEMAVISVEGNYSQSVGAAVHLDLWF